MQNTKQPIFWDNCHRGSFVMQHFDKGKGITRNVYTISPTHYIAAVINNNDKTLVAIFKIKYLKQNATIQSAPANHQ